MEGCYSVAGSHKFAIRHSAVHMKSWVSDRTQQVSSVGIGTYMGSLGPRDDILQFNSIIDSVLLGVNAIDTCSNFRGGRS
jgi:hypothetical protein